jgi:hypothetical protein
MEAVFFFFFTDSTPPASNWILHQFGVQLRGNLDSDSIASLHSAKWDTTCGVPKEAIFVPSYAAFDFGRGVTATVDQQGFELQQEIEAGDAAYPTAPKDRVLPLTRQLITLLDLRSVRSFATQLRMIVPHPHPLELLAERYLKQAASKRARHRLSTVRLTLGYPVDDGEFRVTLNAFGPTAVWKEPHLSVRAELAFGRLTRKRLIEIIANPKEYEDKSGDILMALLG